VFGVVLAFDFFGPAVVKLAAQPVARNSQCERFEPADCLSAICQGMIFACWGLGLDSQHLNLGSIWVAISIAKPYSTFLRLAMRTAE
jgi:hypothetical protein